MMMERRHQEDTFATQFETGDLNDDRKCFDYKDETNQQKQYFTFAKDRQVSNHSADGEAAGITHEEFSGMAVVPEKAQQSSGKAGGKDRDFSHSFDIGNQQIITDDGMACNISNHSQRPQCDDRGDGSQSIETICEVDSITGGKKQQEPERNGKVAHIK